MQYAPADLTRRECYKVLTSFVLPRPIAWVTSIGPSGVVNAAPFSFFNVFCEDPPLCMFAVNRRPDGREKDTLVNIQRSGEFVVHLTDEALALAMHESSGDFPPEIGEPDHLGLKLAPSTNVAVPRLADAPWAMECKTWKTIDVNGDRQLIMAKASTSTSATNCGITMPCACTWSAIIRSAACSPIAIAGRMIGWCSRQRRGSFVGRLAKRKSSPLVVPAKAGSHTA